MPPEDFDALEAILTGEHLHPVFQPVINLRRRTLYGYEGLIRGPSDSPLHSPARLFETATRHGRLLELDYLARRILIEQFARLRLPGRLFININPEVLMSPHYAAGLTRKYLRDCGMSPDRVVIEITETQPVENYALIQTAIEHYRETGFGIAIDDLGAGYSGLKLWSEMHPDFVKIDRHFITGIDSDRIKHQFVRSILEISQSLGCQVITEGVETRGEYGAVRKLGAGFAQGYYFARPGASPPLAADPAWFRVPGVRRVPTSTHTAAGLLKPMPVIDSADCVDMAAEVFLHNPTVQSICVLSQDEPVGILLRTNFMNLYAHRFGRELYGRQPVRRFADKNYLTFEVSTPLDIISKRITGTPDTHVDEFVLIDQGRFAGRGTLLDLLQSISRQQIEIARHANPLTLLPGNVPIMRHLEKLIRTGQSFVMAYCDLDHFKPFNDIYGYARGDEVIALLAATMCAQACAADDFIGHIGGDDFLVFFQRPDWEQSCRAILTEFARQIAGHYTAEDLRRGYTSARDRDNREQRYPLISLSIGALVIADPQRHHMDYIVEQAARAKHSAKCIAGDTLIYHDLKPPDLTNPVPYIANSSGSVVQTVS
jgi:diguanylate cyclase (GGDEF)-like protein